MRNIFRELRQNEVRKILSALVSNNHCRKYIVDIGSGSFPISRVLLLDKLLLSKIKVVSVDKEKSADYKADALDLPFERQTFDYAVCLEIIEHFHKVEQFIFLNELKRILKPRGIVIISLPNYSKIMKPIQDFVWFIREHTTQKEYFHNEKMHTHIGIITPSELVNTLKFFGFRILLKKRFLFYDYIIVIQK